MSKVIIDESIKFFLTENYEHQIEFNENDFNLRINLLMDKMKDNNIDFIFIFGDREHFSNMEYFSGFDCRFEEAVFIVSSNGEKSIIVGNEGFNYSYKIPIKVNRILYQNFSLQGQIKDKLKGFKDILKEIGFNKSKKIGVVGYKYFETQDFGNPDYIFDIPNYIIEDLREVCSKENVINFTKFITGLPDGIRMRLHSAKEIAWAESSATITTNTILKLMKNLKEGITERELALNIKTGLDPLPVFPMINFGEEKVFQGLGSPSNNKLKIGDVCGVAYCVRGALTSRVGVASYDFDTISNKLKNIFMDFSIAHFEAMTAWYETIRVGIEGDKLHKAVNNRDNIKNNHIYLNCGHNIGTDEWTNSPVFENSKIKLANGSHLQVDIISSSSNPVMTSICEDGVVIASNDFREELKKEYPEVYERILKRQDYMRKYLGIQIHDDVLPLSNLNGVYFPFMLNMNKIFKNEK